MEERLAILERVVQRQADDIRRLNSNVADMRKLLMDKDLSVAHGQLNYKRLDAILESQKKLEEKVKFRTEPKIPHGLQKRIASLERMAKVSVWIKDKAAASMMLDRIDAVERIAEHAAKRRAAEKAAPPAPPVYQASRAAVFHPLPQGVDRLRRRVTAIENALCSLDVLLGTPDKIVYADMHRVPAEDVVVLPDATLEFVEYEEVELIPRDLDKENSRHLWPTVRNKDIDRRARNACRSAIGGTEVWHDESEAKRRNNEELL